MGQSSKDCWGIFHHAMFDYPRAIQVKIFNQWNFKGITPGWMTVKFQVPIFNPSIGSSMNLSQPNARSSADASHGRYPKNSVSVGRMMINNPISGYPWVPDFQTNSLSHWLLENGEISSWNWWISPTMWDSIAISKPFPPMNRCNLKQWLRGYGRMIGMVRNLHGVANLPRTKKNYTIKRVCVKQT